MKLNVLHIASLIAIFQSLFMAAFFLQNKKSSRTSNILLAAMLTVFAALIGSTLMSALGLPRYGKINKDIILILSQMAFLIGPLLYLYIRALLDSSFKIHAFDMIHFFPFPLALVYSLYIIFEYGDYMIWMYPGRLSLSALILLQNFLYLLAAWKNIRSFGLTFRSFLSYIDNSRLAWIRFFTGGYIILWLVQLQIFIGWDVLGHPQWCPYGLSLYSVSTFLFFNGLLFFALRRPDTFSHVQKYQSSSLLNSDKDTYRDKLVSLMEQQRTYLNPSLTLAELSQELDISLCHLSQVINESFGYNFRDFINKFRIEESKRLLQSNHHNFNILGIAQESGFNSKSAFNSAFKRHTGITPKEFKKTCSVKEQ
jgi:AraC-like DNA-binding protein